jgi:hypothetical protein
MCDASKYFIGCVIYLKNIDSNSLNYISSHNKALDIQLVGRTMPVLELCAIEYATEKAQKAYDALTGRNIKIKIRDTFVFSDSTIALSWVAKSECEQTKVQKRSVFVNNRVEKIVSFGKYVGGIKLAHVGTNDNAADYTTRLVSPKKLEESTFVDGPKFLHNKFDDIDFIEIPNPMLNNEKDLPKFTVAKIEIEDNSNSVHNIIDLNKYSSLRKAVNVLKTVIGFINKLKLKTPIYTASHPIKCANYKDCELMILKSEQQKSFPEVCTFFESKNRLRKDIPAIVSKTNVIKDVNGLLKVKGKMNKPKIGKILINLYCLLKIVDLLRC